MRRKNERSNTAPQQITVDLISSSLVELQQQVLVCLCCFLLSSLITSLLSVCLSVCLSLCVSLSLSVCLSLPVCLSVCLYLCLSVCLSVCLSLSLSLCLCLSICLCLFVSLSLSVCLSVCLPEMGRWCGLRGILKKLSLCHSIVYCYDGAQRYKHFLEVGRLYQALILLRLAYYLPSASVSSIFMVR